jgi:hypothetical protein
MSMGMFRNANMLINARFAYFKNWKMECISKSDKTWQNPLSRYGDMPIDILRHPTMPINTKFPTDSKIVWYIYIGQKLTKLQVPDMLTCSHVNMLTC